MDFATLGPAGAAVAIVWMFLKFLRDTMNKLNTTIDHNTKVSQQNYKFLKNLNGELRTAAQKKLDGR